MPRKPSASARSQCCCSAGSCTSPPPVPQGTAGTASLTVSNANAGQPYILDSYAQAPGVFPGAWGPLKANVAPASVFEITDLRAPAESRRLYRVRQFCP